MSYRVECAVSGRAVCKATECQEAQMKIAKDELRLGSWVPYEDRGSWAWKHWGCVTGKQLENIRAAIANPAKPGEYLWDMLDGYDSADKGSLDNHPDLQEKVRRVITQGFIDPEDFNGDPEMNKLGEAGIRTAASKKKAREDRKARKAVIEELEAKLAAAEAELATLKANGDPGAKKAECFKEELKAEIEVKMEGKGSSVSVKRVKDEDAGRESNEPPKKRRAAKGKGIKKEEGDSDATPTASKRRAPAKKTTVKKEEAHSDSEAAPTASKRRAPAKKATIKKQESHSDSEAAAAAPPKKRASRAKKGAALKNEPNSDEDEKLSAEAAPIVKKRARRSKKGKALKEEIVVWDDENGDGDAFEEASDEEEEGDEEVEYKPKATRGRKKA